MLQKEFEEYIMQIDEVKKNKPQSGNTKRTKKIIDEVYSILSKDAEKIEEQLYIRKSQLQNQIKKEMNYKYNKMNSFIGGLVGAIIAFFIDQIVHFFVEFFERIKDGTFFEIDCMDILYGESFIEEIVFIICVLFISYVYCTHAEKNDEKNVFQADMCVYEIKKIDELKED